MSETLACLLVSIALLVAARHGRPPGAGPRRAARRARRARVPDAQRARAARGRVRGRRVVARCRARRDALLAPVLVLAGCALTVAPWVAYNLVAVRPPRAAVDERRDDAARRQLRQHVLPTTSAGWDIGCLAPVPIEDGVDASVRSAQRRDVAVDYVRDHLRRVPVVVLARVGRTLDVYGLSSLVALDRGEEKAPGVVWAGIVCWWLLAVAAIVGWRVLGRGASTARDAVVARRAGARRARHDDPVLRRPPHPGAGRAGRRAARGRRPRRRRGVGSGGRGADETPGS